MSKVYLIEDHFLSKLDDIITKKFKLSGSVPVKMHFGETDNFMHIPPSVARKVVDVVKNCGAKPFVCDTLAVYPRGRETIIKHQNTAKDHGFTKETMGCEIKIFNENDMTKTKTENLTVYSPTDIMTAKNIILLSHGKGHSTCAGFGGAIKNVGMGCVGVKTKNEIHDKPRPAFDLSKCTKCGICYKVCPMLEDKSAKVGSINWDEVTCVGCWRCIFKCPKKALSSSSPSFNELLAEATAAVLKEKNVICITYLFNITKRCDCSASGSLPACPDIGFLVSDDPVAIDQAAVDLIEKQCPDFFKSMEIDYLGQVRHGEKLGLGKRKYELVEV
ncbi:MAG: DUF362 domain-containing protein [Candidatus Aenigmatarchaeota archaeon]